MRFIFLILFVATAAAGPVLSPVRGWGVSEGVYVVESEGVALSGAHTLWETEFRFGPIHFTLPYRAPTAFAILLAASALVALLAWLLFLRLTHARRHIHAASYEGSSGKS
jgi:hypothetical protein